MADETGGLLGPCRWCGKRGRNASGWEQFSSYRDSGWTPLCTHCANRRLNNPWNAILPMRRVTEPSQPAPIDARGEHPT